MPFNSETGKLAGQKSVRGKDKVGSELRNKLTTNFNVNNYISSLVGGGNCKGFSTKNKNYFKWHREFHA